MCFCLGIWFWLVVLVWFGLIVKPRVWDSSSTREVTVGTVFNSAKLVLWVSVSVGVLSVYQWKWRTSLKGFVRPCLELNCLDLVSVTNRQEVDSTTEKMIDLSLVAQPSVKFCRIFMNIVSNQQNPFSFSTPSLLDGPDTSRDTLE